MDLYAWVSDGSTHFRQVWQFDDFWKRGNTHHAFLRFTAAAEQRFPNSPLLDELRALRSTMIQQNEEYFLSCYRNPVYWADDFGWWGMALLAASSALNASGDTRGAARQFQLARDSWQQMLERGYDGSNTARPVPHGCANKAPADATGAKNTVTNANLFLLSVRLCSALAETDPPAAQQYRKMALAQRDWFAAWFTDPHGYFRQFAGDTYGLLQERPIAAPDYLEKEHPTWQPGWTWSGDQGLIVAALAELSFLPMGDGPAHGEGRGDAPQAVHPAFEKVLLGVRQLLFGANDAILREAPFEASFGDAYGPDYVAGRGILMRYLSEPSVRRVHRAPFAPEAITATAAAVWNSRDARTGLFAADWSPGNNAAFNQTFREKWGQGDVGVSWRQGVGLDGVRQAAGLDVLTAMMSLG